MGIETMITMDGSRGEGGGQILRSSLALSLLTGKPVRLTNIRAGRKKPGLMHQHLAAVNAAAEIGQANVRGNTLGSQELVFEPQEVRPGSYFFSTGTAGSTTLVLQTVLPALLVASGESRLILEGGTHNPFAPPFDFLDKAYFPLIKRMGPEVRATLQRPGFFPAGGGRMVVEIQPVSKLKPIEIVERGAVIRREGTARVARLPRDIAYREMVVLRKELDWPEECFCEEEITNSRGPGNVVIVEIVSEQITEVFSGFGSKGIRAEHVASAVAAEAREYLKAGVPVGPHLADQIMLPMAMAGGGRYRTTPLTLHSLTHMETLRSFLQVDIKVLKIDDNVQEIQVST